MDFESFTLSSKFKVKKNKTEIRQSINEINTLKKVKENLAKMPENDLDLEYAFKTKLKKVEYGSKHSIEKYRILKNKVQFANTGAFLLSPDTKCHTILESSSQPYSGNLGPTTHNRVNLGCQPPAFATQVKISPSDFRSIYLFTPLQI